MNKITKDKIKENLNIHIDYELGSLVDIDLRLPYQGVVGGS